MNEYQKGIRHGKSIAILTILHWLESIDDNFPMDKQTAELIAQGIKEGIYQERD